MTAPIAPTAPPDVGPPTAPDFTNLDRAAKLMQAFSSVKPDSPDFEAAQTAFARAHTIFANEAAQHAQFYGQRAQNQLAEPPGLIPPGAQGTLTAGRIGATQGLLGTGGAVVGGALGSIFPGPGTLLGAIGGGFAGSALAKPFAQLAARLTSGADAGDVNEQWKQALEGHSTAQLVGNVAGGAAAGFGINRASRYFAQAALNKSQAVLMAQRVAQGDLKTQTMAKALDLTTKRVALVEQQLSAAEAMTPAKIQEAQLTVDKLAKQIDVLSKTKPTEQVAAEVELAKTRVALLKQELEEETARLTHPERAATRQAAHETIQAKRDIAVAQARKLQAQAAGSPIEQWVAANMSKPPAASSLIPPTGP